MCMHTQHKCIIIIGNKLNYGTSQWQVQCHTGVEHEQRLAFACVYMYMMHLVCTHAYIATYVHSAD